jgi:predicted metal-dependent hydrolase
VQTEKKIHLQDIGEVIVKRSTRARRVSIRIRPLGGVELVIPNDTDEKQAIAFLHTKVPWIQKSLDKIKQKEAQLSVFDEQSDFKTRTFNLKIQSSERKDVRLELKNGNLQVTYPSHLEVTHPGIQEAIRHGIEEGLRIEAKSFLPGRLSWLAQQHQFTYQQVFIKNLKSRWGSCSNRNNINLNLHLMRLPDHLIDYVLLHELCHTRVKNHGPGFWRELNRITNGRARELDRAMKNYQTKIY